MRTALSAGFLLANAIPSREAVPASCALRSHGFYVLAAAWVERTPEARGVLFDQRMIYATANPTGTSISTAPAVPPQKSQAPHLQ